MSKVPMAISHYDLNHFLKEEGVTVEDLSEVQLKEVLDYLGMDINTYEVEEVLHRPKYTENHQPWQGKRIVGWERQDKQWLLSCKSSIENVIASQTDGGHAAELMRMSCQNGQTAVMVGHLEKLAAQAEVEQVVEVI